MLIGKIWDEASQKYFWAEGDDLDSLTEALECEIADYGGNSDINPAKIQVWDAIPKTVRATYTIE